jgi:hypothetical protein
MERIEDLEQTTREHEREIFDMDPYKRAVEELMSSRTPQRLTVGEERINALTVANAFFLAKVEALEQRNDTLMQQNTGLECTVIKLEAEQRAKNAILKEQNTGLECTVIRLEAEQRAMADTIFSATTIIYDMIADLNQKNAILTEQNTGLECTVIRLEAEQRAMADTIKQIQANVAELETGKRKRLEDGNASLEDDKRQRS